MLSFSRLAFVLLVSACVMAMAAPKQMVFGFGKRSMADISDMPEDVPMKRYKPRSFAMGFGKRAAMRSFNMGFGKRSAEPQIDVDSF
ncbi:Neuropeptide-Like Protein [Caenorhabditis elegans]|uniref:Neuropeptide-Like Protein n=1 Tax=Caenorhabditis elegans TaxID=6239 RepID=H2KZS6_CAEEL|nr:Neuropeptide-Like Protein [Caenorhabditis elegans]CCD83566.1 Neuropeptide-Like Protein [Caenorhabditis elegans]|eukprot:NP_001257288.1 Neuropeptide-Like Protein [Caenorhabditis elegans]